MRLLIAAPAKLNLGLEVLARRDDGYHDLRSVMVSVDLCDLVTFQRGEGEVQMTGPYARPHGVAPGANLVHRALEMIGAVGWQARVYKRIPAGAGLGGGSADAAAVLRSAGGLGVEMSPERAGKLAFALGADVPFQLALGAALVGGAGEDVDPLPVPRLWAAVAWPGLHASTAAVFAELRPDEMSDGARVSAAALALQAGESLDPARELPNALTGAACRRYPALRDASEALRRAGWQPRLTGSGAAMFQLCSTPSEARRLAAAAPGGMTTWVLRLLPPGEVARPA